MGKKICIVHNHSRYSGVSTFIYTIAEHMTKVMEHEVHIVVPDQSNKEYISYLSKVATVHSKWTDWADVYIFNYKSDAVAYRDHEGYKIFVVHGLMEKEYLPPGYPIVNRVVCMSKRGFNWIDTECEKVLCNQPINTDRFYPRKNINERLEKVLIVDSRNNSFYIDKVMTACSKMGIYCSMIGEAGFDKAYRFDVENALNSADLVIGYGRSIYEAMLCGRAGIVYGINGGDGYITVDNFHKNVESNCSGWGQRSMPRAKDITIKRIMIELEKYESSHGQHNREMAKCFAIEENINSFLI